MASNQEILAQGPKSSSGFAGKVEKFNDAIAAGPIGKWFRLDGCGHPLERAGSRFVSTLQTQQHCIAVQSLIQCCSSSSTDD